jgi:hypothetical protein
MGKGYTESVTAMMREVAHAWDDPRPIMLVPKHPARHTAKRILPEAHVMSNNQGSTNKGNQKGGDQKPNPDKPKAETQNQKLGTNSPPAGPGKGRTPSQGK